MVPKTIQTGAVPVTTKEARLSLHRPIFAADRTFLRIRDAAILADLKSTGSIQIEIVCAHWNIIVRGAVGTSSRQWFTMDVPWDAVQSEAENPLIDMVERAATALSDIETKERRAHKGPR
jgi:hypothetical protein